MDKVDVGVCKLIIGSQSFGNVIWRDAQSQLRALLAERERHLKVIVELKASIDEAMRCFSAAETEGLSQRLAEYDQFELGQVPDLVTRRLLYAVPALQRAQAAIAVAEGK